MERMILPLAFALRCVSLSTTHLTQRFEFTAGRFDIKQCQWHFIILINSSTHISLNDTDEILWWSWLVKENLFWYEQSQSIEWTNSTVSLTVHHQSNISFSIQQWFSCAAIFIIHLVCRRFYIALSFGCNIKHSINVSINQWCIFIDINSSLCYWWFTDRLAIHRHRYD